MSDIVRERYRFSKEDCQKGFAGLVAKRFGGDRDAAKKYVGDLGRASFYYSMKPILATNILSRHQAELPELFVYERGQVVDINWSSEWLANCHKILRSD